MSKSSPFSSSSMSKSVRLLLLLLLLLSVVVVVEVVLLQTGTRCYVRAIGVAEDREQNDVNDDDSGSSNDNSNSNSNDNNRRSSSSSSRREGIPERGTINTDPSKVEQLSWSPHVKVYKEFLAKSECDYLIEIVFDDRNNVRSVKRGKESGDLVVEDIERRIAEWTHVNQEFSESFVIRKDFAKDVMKSNSNRFRKISDSLGEFQKSKANNGRVNDMHLGTVVLILKDFEMSSSSSDEVATTTIAFPKNDGGKSSFSCDQIEEGKRSLFVNAKRGDAVFWRTATHDQKVDSNATGVGECFINNNVDGKNNNDLRWTATKYLHLVRVPSN